MTPPLSPEAVAQMVADREAGTPGPWAYRPDKYDDWGTVKAGRFVLCRVRDPDALGEAIFALHRDKGTDPWEVNARRIARLPDLEAAYLTHAAELAALRAENEELDFLRHEGGPDSVAAMEIELATLRASEAAAMERVTTALEIAHTRHIPDQPAAYGGSELEWARRQYASLRRDIIAAITPTADKEPKP